MKLSYLLFFILFLISSTLFSQDFEYEKYDWKSQPKFTKIETDSSENAVIIDQKFIQEFYNDGDNFTEIRLFHKRAQVLSDKGIEDMNKVYFSVPGSGKVLIEKARVIKPDGTVVNLEKDQIKEAEDEDSHRKYHYFAFEGLEKGSEIEYLYVLKKEPSYSGYFFNVQTKYPKLHYSFDIFCPSHLGYKFKSYNGLSEFQEDTSFEKKHHWFLEMDSVPKFKSERFIKGDPDKMSFIYKLDKNYYTGKKDLYSYGKYASTFYDVVYDNDKKTGSVYKKLLKKIPVDKSSEENLIRSVDNYFKENFIYFNASIPSLKDPKFIVANKAFNDIGALKMYVHILKLLNVTFECVATSDRFDMLFDKDFESYLYLSDYLLYFPKSKKYLSATNRYSRLGFPPEELVNTYGLFIKEVSVGDFSSGIGKVKFIQAVTCDKSEEKMELNVAIDEDFSETTIKMKNMLYGYNAGYIQPAFDLIKDEEKMDEISRNILLDRIGSEETIDNFKIENTGGKYFGVKPLIVSGTIITDKFIENAGKKRLFNVGKLIGEQMELYKEKERNYDLEFQYAHGYLRTIIISYPEGYIPSNLDQLNYKEIYSEKSDTLFAFISTYKTEGNTITITIKEWYKGVSYPKSTYEDYRRVVNAAANFNKFNIFFTKKQ